LRHDCSYINVAGCLGLGQVGIEIANNDGGNVGVFSADAGNIPELCIGVVGW